LDLAWLATAVLPEASADDLGNILDLDRDEFLAGFSLPDAPEFDNWADKLYALRESFMPISQTRYYILIVRVKIARGKLDQAAAILDQVVEEFNWKSSWSHEITSIALVDAQLQLALGKPERVFTRWQEQIRQFRAAGFKIGLAREWWLRAEAHLALGDVDQARNELLKARAIAEEKDERTELWQILAALSALEEAHGDRETAEQDRDEAREVIAYIAENAGELRESFLAQPAVAAVLAERQG
ncbi:MAG: hypothetical protein R3293_28680, partial [Candidatus Promineifilaceae bacterium]|nr:hypothetical protein [Candidatus Promineifilaceae bacterium]